MTSKFLMALEQRRLLSVSAQISLLNNEDVIQAGQSVHVSALGTGAGGGSDFGSGDALTSQIQWDFGDPNGKYNHLPGFNAAHVYDQPGTYNLMLRIQNPDGETDVESRLIRVLPNTRQTIYVDPLGNDANDGHARDTAIASIHRLVQLLSDNTVVLFRRGMTFNVDRPISLPFTNVDITRYGPGTAPELQLPAGAGAYAPIFTMSGASHQITIENLKLDSAGSSPIGEAIRAAGSNIVIKNCEFEHVYTAIQTSDQTTGLLAYDNTAGTLKGYFAYVRGSDQAYLGNTVGDSTAQHNIRIYGDRILCYGNDLTNLPDGSSLATLRVNSGSDIYWANNTLHGGQMLVGPLAPTSAGALASQAVDAVVIENNHWEEVPGHWSGHDRIHMYSGTSNVMIRNNILEATNSTAIAAETRKTYTFSDGPITRTMHNLRILNNTVIDNGTNGAFLNVGGGTNNVITLKNSLYVAPNMKIGPYTAAAVRVTGRSDLGNFTSLSSGGGVDGNVWNLPVGAWSLGVNYVSASGGGASAYRTPMEWEHNFGGRVGRDVFENLSEDDLDGNGAPPRDSEAASAGVQVGGVITDLTGAARSAAAWSAGAVQALL